MRVKDQTSKESLVPRRELTPDEFMSRSAAANSEPIGLFGVLSRYPEARADYEAVRAKCPEFDRLLPLMEIAAQAFSPNWGVMTVREYLEALYCVVAHASFAEDGRARILGRSATAPTSKYLN